MLPPISFLIDNRAASKVISTILFAHNTTGRWWWYRVWSFSTVFYCILLPCERYQYRGSLTKQCLTWKSVWSKGMELNSSKCTYQIVPTDTHQSWWHQKITSTGADFYKHGMQTLVHVHCSDHIVKQYLVTENSVTVLFVSFLFSMEINRRHYLWSYRHIWWDLWRFPLLTLSIVTCGIQ